MTCPIVPAPVSERLTGPDLIHQAIRLRSVEDADLRTAILDPAAAGDVHRPQPPARPMSPGYQQQFHSPSTGG